MSVKCVVLLCYIPGTVKWLKFCGTLIFLNFFGHLTVNQESLFSKYHQILGTMVHDKFTNTHVHVKCHTSIEEKFMSMEIMDSAILWNLHI